MLAGAVDAVNVVAYGEVGGQITLNGINPKTNLYVYWSSDGQDLISKNTHGVEKKGEEHGQFDVFFNWVVAIGRGGRKL